MSNASNVAYQDTIKNTLLVVSIVENCIEDYYDINLKEFIENGMEVFFSESKFIESKSGSYCMDEYNLTRSDYPNEIKQYMVYKKIDHKQLLVITITNEKKYEQYIKFLIGEVFYHFKFNYKRIAFPYEEITYMSNISK